MNFETKDAPPFHRFLTVLTLFMILVILIGSGA